MKSSEDLRRMLRGMDRKSYPAYKALKGSCRFTAFQLFIDHVQGDPFASPSSLHVEISHREAGFPKEYYSSRCTRRALADFLTRQLEARLEKRSFKVKGSGKSGLLATSRCGQEVLERTACEISDTKITARFHVGLPASGRSILAGELETILFDFLPRCVEECFFYRNLDKTEVEAAVFLAEDQEALRKILRAENLVAFVANGSILPRKSGVSDMPMKESIPFFAPASMERRFILPHKGEIAGMAVPQGITLIAGGGYHGKSTLLEALQNGVYDHVAGDGREYVVTDDTAVKLRAEDGRAIRNVDISLFINDLPSGKDTSAFSSEDASGSTSQAAAAIESLEAGVRLLLIDEDTSATNFMVRDRFMQQVISRDKEPITPFLERARDLYERENVSTILVAGSSGAFFHIADHIIQMDCYRPFDITNHVKKLCEGREAPETEAPGFKTPDYKRILPAYRRSRQGGKDYYGRQRQKSSGPAHMKIKTLGRDSFSLDREQVDLRYVEQLTDAEQTAALAHLLRYGLEELTDGRNTVRQIVSRLLELLEERGWEPFCGACIPCGLAKPRRQEMFACLNRFRGQEEKTI